MGDVIEFPSQTLQEWAGIERTLRKTFNEANASTEMQNEILIKMKEVFQRYNVKFTIPIALPKALHEQQKEAIVSSIEQALDNYQKQLNDLMNHVILDRLLLEIELYKLRFE